MNYSGDYTPKLSRNSIRTVSIIEDDEETLNLPRFTEQKKWRLSHLKGQFESFQLDELFKKYINKINHGYYSLYLILQSVLTLTHLIILIISNHDKDSMIKILPDLILYLVVSILSVIGIFTIDKIVKKLNKWNYMQIVSFILIYFINLFVPLYHFYDNGVGQYGNEVGHFRPAYSCLLVISVYMFFNVYNNLVAIGMGIFVSFTHILVLYFVTYSELDIIWRRISSDIIYQICFNGLGIYFRYMNEIVKRRSFLDRRDCVLTTFQLDHEKEQYEQLLSSIIPQSIREKVISKDLNSLPATETLEPHENVTILFADIVHYTAMTLRLNINELLETLNDLFVGFDDASQELGVTRIKFLGDCYYCVAGLPPNPPPNHAESCVDLGLKMIAIIAKIRRKKNLDVNMRIGIHTGKVISGLIGVVKYQFDIWSKDVNLANIMETEGEPGKVHITQQTKDLLKKHYNILPHTKGNTVPHFIKENIRTYLVSPEHENNNHTPSSPKDSVSRRKSNIPWKGTLLQHMHSSSIDSTDETDTNNNSEEIDQVPAAPRQSIFVKNNSGINLSRRATIDEANNEVSIIERSNITNSGRYSAFGAKSKAVRSSEITDRRTAFMNTNIKRFKERNSSVNHEMQKAIDKMNFSKYDQFYKNKDINSFLIRFRDCSIENRYLQVPDPLFKYYLIFEIIIIICVYLLQNITLPSWDTDAWPVLATVAIIVFILIPLTWLHPFYVAKYTDMEPENTVVKKLVNCSKFITDNFFARWIIYTTICALFSYCVLSEVIECEETIEKVSKTIKTNFLRLVITDNSHNPQCVIPWHMTETCALAIIMTFIFLRITIWIKFIYAVVLTVLYAYCVTSFSKGFYMASGTFNYNIKPEIAHVLNIVYLTFSLHLIDRQTDYMNRLDYLWSENVQNKQEKANELQRVNCDMLLNILPRHVAKIYLDINPRGQDLYHEHHENVAVMFASIVTDEVAPDLDEKFFLSIMNEYITAFDMLLKRQEFRSIEKIKIAKWTYMVACGLKPDGQKYEMEKHVTQVPIITLLNFACNMLREVNKINRVSLQPFSLRVGISHGSIVAGVVGSKKPLYDIWGNPCNMASRMDTTGIPNHIQVLEETYHIIDDIGYVCKERGQVVVKGKKDPLTTYFVQYHISDDGSYNLIKKNVDL